VSASGATNAYTASVTLPVFAVGGTGVTSVNDTITTTNADGAATVTITGGGTGAVYYYTLNGKTPNLASARYASPVVINANGKKTVTLKAVACVNGKLSAVKTVKYKLDAKINSITLTPKSGAYAGTVAAVGLGKKLTLTATLAPTKPLNKTLAWTSSDTGVATVDSKGVVTVKKTGVNATITATNTYSGVSKSITVVAYPLTKSISVAPKSVKLATMPCTTNGVPLAKTATLAVAPNPADALNGAKNFSYKSSKPKIASVDENGVITALASGSAKITATARDGSGKAASCAVTVIKPAEITAVTCKEGQPASLTPDYVVGKGKTINLTAVMADKKATNAKVIWASDNTSIATVSGGKVKGVAVGITNVTVRTADSINPAVWNVKITVKEATGSLKSNATATTLNIRQLPSSTTADSFTWTITNNTAGAHNTLYAYSVKNKKIAAVAGSGASVTINPLAKGSTTITAKAVDGSGKTATIKITVLKKVTRIYLSYPVTQGIAYNKSMKFGASVYPTDASNKKLLWEVTNGNTFKVDSNGKLKLKKKVPSYKSYNGDYENTFLSVRAKDDTASPRYYVSGTPSVLDGRSVYQSTVSTSALKIYGYNDPLLGLFFGNKNSSSKKYTSYKMQEGKSSEEIAPWLLTRSAFADSYTTINVTSSNDRVAEYGYVGGKWQLFAYSPGTTTITIKTTDGSNKSAKLKVTVKAVGDSLEP